MKFRNTWLLLGIAILFGLYIYFIEFKKAAKDEEQKEAAQKVMNFAPDDVKGVTLKNEHGEFQLERNDKNKWVMKTPVADDGDDAAISGMLTALSTEKFSDTVDLDTPDAAKNYGLDQPKSSVSLTLKDGKTQKVSAGNDAPMPGKTYLQRDGEKKVLLGDSGFKTQINKEQKDLRNKGIMRVTKADVVKFTVTYNTKDNKSVAKLSKGKDGWLLDEGDQTTHHQAAPGDSEVVNTFLTNVESLKATDFPSEKGDDPKELKKYGLDKPEITVVLEGEKGHLETLQFSPKKENNVYVKADDKPSIYAGFVSSVDQLFHKADDFRDRHLPFVFKKEDVSEIKVKTSMVDVNLVKKGSSWELATLDSSNQVASSQVDALFSRLAALRVNEFLDTKEKPRGLVPAEKQIILKDSKGQDVFVLTWGEKTKSGKSYYVKTNKMDSVFGVDVGGIDSIPQQTLIEPKLLPTPGPSAAASGGVVGGKATFGAGKPSADTASKPAPPAPPREMPPEAHELPHVTDPSTTAPGAGHSP